MSVEILPGLLVLHGNRLELLKEAVFEWVARQPLAPLEEETFLVQSNGVAEWLKMALAEKSGICAATRVELPARFLWRAYRQVLGRDAVPSFSPLDKTSLTWRLMRLLPRRLHEPVFAPLAGFLHTPDLGRRLQLAQRLADLYDQYQVYRIDWLDAWAQGRDTLPGGSTPTGRERLLDDDQRWQAVLWRDLVGELADDELAPTRPEVHKRFLAALHADAPLAQPLSRRVVLFGMSHIPTQTLEALAAYARHSQVLLAIPNPCRFHWADIVEGRELMRMQRQRHPHRAQRDLAGVPMQEMHAHAHPLLAAWGRQGRDFVRQLDAFDDARAAQQRFAIPRIDLFDEDAGVTLLEQVQAHVRDLLPLAEHPRADVPARDRSVVFHVAHSAQREVEILHDQLLAMLADSAAGIDDASDAQPPLKPRDIVVMVPEIDGFAPAIRAVFGQYSRQDKRYIPFDIADVKSRGNNPVVVALEWLLRLPQQRCRLAEVRDLLDVPAIAARFDVSADQLPTLAAWMAGAGVRWGLHADQRAELGLNACGEQNTWMFGLRRMLLGYASGEGATFDDIEPYGEVGGLEASVAGSLADLVDTLAAWWQLGSQPATPGQWAGRCRRLIEDLFEPTDERERATVGALQRGLQTWLSACDSAEFDEPVPLAVLREAWLAAIDEPTLGKRFLAGGVTFCTLMPMRAVPFEVVCLLGMNDGDYPRQTQRSDFDLMGLPGLRRPGDRSRRDDDRYLMLEALLSARRTLYVSWVGRSVRDNSEQPPSVLVAQLRDYLTAGWTGDVVAERTTEHPLQPFSRRYFEGGVEQDVYASSGHAGSIGRSAVRSVGADSMESAESSAMSGGSGLGALFTFAREWRAAHIEAVDEVVPASTAAHEAALDAALTVDTLARFLANPVKAFFRARLDVVFQDDEAAADDDEAFAIAGLDEYGLVAELIGDVDRHPEVGDSLHMAERIAQVQRSGRLPIGEMGARAADKLMSTLAPMLAAWRGLQRRYPDAAAKQPLRYPASSASLASSLDRFDSTADASHASELDMPPVDADGDLRIDDWLDSLRADGEERVWMALVPHRVCSGDLAKKKPLVLRGDKLIGAWVRALVASACGFEVRGVIVGRDATVTVGPVDFEEAQAVLGLLLDGYATGMSVPLPVAAKTALAWEALIAGDASKNVSSSREALREVASVYEGGFQLRGECEEPCLARCFPDFEALISDGRFEEISERLYGPMQRWLNEAVTFEPHGASPAMFGEPIDADREMDEEATNE
ncbi:MAG: exodeoxyribonuclease subunit gamma [Rhizobacter sp.]|nr:exodeoxyribonuclease subunit gamma [Rhizobacter sp.]